MSFDTADAEDAAFYAHLTSQILLLMDEDDVTYATRTRKGAMDLGWRPVGGGGSGSGRSLISGKYFGWLEDGRSLGVPGWMESLWANNGTGTGVFIPRAAPGGKPRRKRQQKPRKNKNGGRIHSSA